MQDKWRDAHSKKQKKEKREQTTPAHMAQNTAIGAKTGDKLTMHHVIVALREQVGCSCRDCARLQRQFVEAADSALAKLPLDVRLSLNKIVVDGGRFVARYEFERGAREAVPTLLSLAGFSELCETCLGSLPCKRTVAQNIPLDPLEMAVVVSVLNLHVGLDCGRIKPGTAAEMAATARTLYRCYVVCSTYV